MTYDKSLNEWLLDPLVSMPWNRDRIAQQIREAPQSGILDLSGLIMLKLPREVWELNNLTKLVLIKRDFDVFPPPILNMLQLNVLDLSFNKIPSLPETIQNIKNLTHLVFEKNEITSLPTEIGNLVHLSCLDLFGNKITSLPTELGKLKSLEMLILTNNPLTSIPSELNGLRINTLCVPAVPALPAQLDALKNMTYDQFALPEIPSILTSVTTLTLSKIVRLHLGLFNLTQLTDLTMNGDLTSLPAEIGRLTHLTKLDLSKNALTALPDTFAALGHLSRLTLKENQFIAFPTVLLQLPRLQKIYLQANNIEIVPPEIERLRSLRKLDLSFNQLASLPIEIGNLVNLEYLKLDYNPLTSLPLSLGQLSELTDLGGEGCTNIESMVWYLIRQQCTLRRGAEADVVLPVRFEKWARIGNRKLTLGTLTKQETITLNEWLLRLEKTKDFAKTQEALAETVCAMLSDVFQNPSFRELFFAQAGANLERCEDRAAMAFNEIYTSWKVVCGDGDLAMMKGVSKTLALRKELLNLMKNRDERESVEIILFYEILLKEELGLATAITKMSYATIGERSWIDKARLVRGVNENWFNELYNLPIFQSMLEKNEGVQKKFADIYQLYRTDLEVLEDQEDLAAQCQKGEIMQTCEEAKKGVALEWFKNNERN